MKASKMLISTLKEAPQEAKIASHVLLLRAGMMKNLVGGVYNFLPLGLRVLHKIEDIIKEEMDNAGCLEILCSAIQPKELWEESGRWFKYGPELMRFKDRHEREFCLGPTHEEVFTSMVKELVKSPKFNFLKTKLDCNIQQLKSFQNWVKWLLQYSREATSKEDHQILSLQFQQMKVPNKMKHS